ncbi:hypothetical protein GGI04_003215 [Coemansia thaxteri]|nr:hypothetical protein GGI04_003215 [Coemansia thaxteri]
MPCCALHRHARFAFAVLILACVTLAAPVHIVLPDVVTLQGGNTVTLYSPPSRRLDTLQTDPAADDAIISINQDMLLHALVPSLNVDDPDDGTSSAAPDTRPDLAFDHSKNLDVIAQLSANVEDNANDNIFGTSSSWEKLPISNKRTSSTSLRPTTPRSKSSRSSTSTSMSETNTATSFTSDHDLSSSPTRSTKKSAKPTSTGTAASSDSASLSTDTPTTAQTSSARLVNTSHTRTVELSIQTDLGDTKSGLYPETSTRKQARSSPSPTPSTTLSSEAGSEEASSLATPALSTTSTSPVSASTALHTSTAPRLLGGGIWDSLLATSSASSLPSAIAPSTGLLASSKSATNALSSSNTLQQPASSTDSGVVVIPLTQVPPKQLSDPSSTSLATSAAGLALNFNIWYIRCDVGNLLL